MIDADGHVVHEVIVSLPVEEVFEFFTDASRLVRWLGLSVSLDAIKGGEFCFEIVPGQFCRGRMSRSHDRSSSRSRGDGSILRGSCHQALRWCRSNFSPRRAARGFVSPIPNCRAI